jgi:hypothetical protein
VRLFGFELRSEEEPGVRVGGERGRDLDELSFWLAEKLEGAILEEERFLGSEGLAVVEEGAGLGTISGAG